MPEIVTVYGLRRGSLLGMDISKLNKPAAVGVTSTENVVLPPGETVVLPTPTKTTAVHCTGLLTATVGVPIRIKLLAP